MADKKKKNWLKIALIAGGVAAFLMAVMAVSAVILVKKKMPPEKMKSMAQETLSEQLGRKVTVGDVKFSFFKGFEIADLSIGNRKGPGWKPGDMVAAKRIAISYQLFPLLWFELRLGEILLIEPRILVERRGLEEFNFSDLVTPAKPAPAAKKGAAPKGGAADLPLLVRVDTVSIQKGRLTYIDHLYKPAQTTELPSLTLRVKNISLTGSKTTFDVQTPIKAAGATYEVSASGSYKLFLKKGSVKDLAVKGSFSGIDFQLSGSAKDVIENFAPDMKGSVKVDLSKLPALLPKDAPPLPKELRMSGLVSEDFGVAGNLKDGFKVNSVTDATAADVRFGDAFLKPSGLKAVVKADVVSGTDYLKLPLLEVALGEWLVKGSAAYTGMPPHPTLKGNPAYALSLTTPKPLALKDLAALLPMAKDLNLSGSLNVNVKYSGKPLDAKSTKLDGLVSLEGVNAGNKMGKILEGLSGKLVLKENLIEVPAMKFRLLDSPTGFSFRMSEFNVAQLYDPSKLNALITYRLDSNDVNLENLLALAGPPKKKEQAPAPKGEGKKAAAPAPKPVPISAGLRLDGGMSFKSFYLKKIRFTDAAVKTTLSKKVFKSTASVKGFDGASSGSFQMDLAQAVPPYSFNLKMAGVKAEAAIGQAVDSFVTKNPEQYKDKIAGSMNFDFSGTGRGFDSASAPKNLKGNGTFSLVGVRIKALALMGGLFKNLKDKKEEVKMDRLDGTVSVASEKVTLKANSAGSTGKMAVDGVIGFDGMYAPEMKVLNDIRKEYLDSDAFFGSLPDNVKSRVNLDKAADAQGFVPVDFKLTGPVNKAPGPGALDLSRLMKNIVNNEAKAVKQKAVEGVQEKIGDKLKGIFGK